MANVPRAVGIATCACLAAVSITPIAHAEPGLTAATRMGGIVTASVVTCGGRPASIVTTARQVRGTSGDDVIVVLGRWRHTVHARGGDDVVCGSEGVDVVHAGPGHDVVHGMGGRDRLYGGSGDDTLDGGAGEDRAFGQDGDDALLGGPGADRLRGGTGDDRVDGQDGDDRCFGDRGDDDVEAADRDARDDDGEDRTGPHHGPGAGSPDQPDA